MKDVQIKYIVSLKSDLFYLVANPLVPNTASNSRSIATVVEGFTLPLNPITPLSAPPALAFR
jgi:hypothetical protein